MPIINIDYDNVNMTGGATGADTDKHNLALALSKFKFQQPRAAAKIGEFLLENNNPQPAPETVTIILENFTSGKVISKKTVPKTIHTRPFERVLKDHFGWKHDQLMTTAIPLPSTNENLTCSIIKKTTPMFFDEDRNEIKIFSESIGQRYRREADTITIYYMSTEDIIMTISGLSTTDKLVHEFPEGMTHLKTTISYGDYISDFVQPFPETLRVIKISGQFNGVFKPFPASLQILELAYDYAQPLPDLPEGLLELTLGISSPSRLPSALRILKISGNLAGVLPELPESLRLFEAHKSYIKIKVRPENIDRIKKLKENGLRFNLTGQVQRTDMLHIVYIK